MTTLFNFPPCPLPAGARVWVYLRDSGGEGQDLASQRAYVVAYCEHYNLRIVRRFEDAAAPGGSVAGRDEFELMIDMARYSDGPAVDGVLYWDTKRFARNVVDSQFYKATLRRRGYRLVSLSDDIPDNEFSVVVESFLEWKAQKDREDISKDSKRGLAFIVGMKDAQGNYLGLFPGRPPTFFTTEKYDTGLKRNDGRQRIVQRLLPDPDTWDLGKRAWVMRADGASYRQIEDEINLCRGDTYKSTYAAVFRNEIYTGRLRYGGRVYDDFVPALATPEQWAAVQALRKTQSVKSGQQWPMGQHPRQRGGSFLLTGLCHCSYCQARMNGETNKHADRAQGWRYYVCTRRRQRGDCEESKQVSAETLERRVVDAVVGQVLTVDFIDQLAVTVMAQINGVDHHQQIGYERRRVNELEKAVSNLVNLAEQSGSPALLARLTERESELAVARRTVERLEEEARQEHLRINSEVIVSELMDIRRGITGRTPQRSLLQQVVRRVTVGRELAQIEVGFNLHSMSRLWRMPPTESELLTWHLNVSVA